MRVPRLWVKIYNFLLWGGLIGILLAGACASEWGLFAGMAVSLAGIAAAPAAAAPPSCGISSVPATKDTTAPDAASVSAATTNHKPAGFLAGTWPKRLGGNSLRGAFVWLMKYL